MPTERPTMDVAAFARWLARREPAATPVRPASEELLTAARAARAEFARAAAPGRSRPGDAPAAAGPVEVLELLAAASAGPDGKPPELLTPRGFRVTLAYDDAGPDRASICVLVCCPPDLVDEVQGKSAYLWSGGARFELGQFDADGKAIGTLPAGIEITLADFAAGIVKLEAPSAPRDF